MVFCLGPTYLHFKSVRIAMLKSVPCFSAEGSDNRPESSHDATLKEEILDETVSASEVRGENNKHISAVACV